MIIELTESDFEQKTRGGIVVVLFYSGSLNIAPGELLSPAANHRYGDDVKFMMIDAGRYPEIARRFGISGFPAVLFMRNGMKKNLIQNVSDPGKILDAAEENACYRCVITRGRAEKRKNRRR